MRSYSEGSSGLALSRRFPTAMVSVSSCAIPTTRAHYLQIRAESARRHPEHTSCPPLAKKLSIQIISPRGHRLNRLRKMQTSNHAMERTADRPENFQKMTSIFES